MINRLSKLLNIRSDEWPRLLYLYMMHFIYITGLVWGELILEASFLQEVGVESLRWFFIAKAIISIPMVAIYSGFADRITNSKLLITIILIGSTVISFGLLLLSQDFIRIAYPLLYVAVFVPFYDIYAAHWFTYANGFYDTRSAKRIIPILSTSISAAGIFGGLTIPYLNQLLSPISIVVVWLISLLIVALLAGLMPYILPVSKEEEPTTTVTHSEKQASYIDNLREGYRYVVQSNYLRWMALSVFLLSLLLTFVQFQYSVIFLDELKTVENISTLTGRLTSLSNIVIFAFQTLFLSRVMSRFGLGNTNLIFPVGTLAISSSLIFSPSLVTASLAFINRTEFAGFGYSINSLLYNAVPLRIKGRARIFITGTVEPLGSLVVGGLLVIPFVQTTTMVAVIIGLLACGYLFSEWTVRKKYSQALLKMLEEEDFSFLLSQDPSNIKITDPTALQGLQNKLNESKNHEFTVFIAKLISQAGGKLAIPILTQTIKETEEGHTRAALIDVLAAENINDDTVTQLYIEYTSDPEAKVRLSAINGLVRATNLDDESTLNLALEMLADDDVEVRVQILLTLARTQNFQALPIAVEALEALLGSENLVIKARGVRVLGEVTCILTGRQKSGVTKSVYKLSTYLFDPEDQVRLQATLAIEELSHNQLTEQVTDLLLQQMSGLIDDPVERIRQATLIIYSHLGNQEAYPILLKGISDPSNMVRNTAIELMVEVGKPIIPVIHSRLNAPDPQLRKMTTVILSRINPREFGALVNAYVTGNLLSIYTNHNCLSALQSINSYRSISILQTALEEQNQKLLDELFYLLSAIHDAKDIRLISEALQKKDSRIRANAEEALEGLTSPQTAQLIGRILEAKLNPKSSANIQQLGLETWQMQQSSTTEVVKDFAMKSDHVWLRAIATLSLGELGAINASPKEKQATRRKRPRRQARNLSGSNGDDSGKKRSRRRNRITSPLNALFNDSEDSEDNISTSSEKQPANEKANSADTPINLTLSEIEALLETLFDDSSVEVRLAARAAKRIISGEDITTIATQEEAILLSAVEKIIFLKGVPFFQGMTIDQLTVLANVCEEQLFEEDTRIFNQNETGGTLYVVVNGRVGIEQEKRKGSYARLATIEAHSYFGESNLFDNSPHIASAMALQDTLTLRLRREPLIALARQYPELSLELINVLSERLREANDRVADLTKTRPRELHKLFDQFD
ncbi:cyclic nucleotide-binding domain-containing protein [Anaerolineales bacterium HSG25]|nr:cyclic nucleotide-binding domain-containing protein [Anaerolineales bacterium HSG25]